MSLRMDTGIEPPNPSLGQQISDKLWNPTTWALYGLSCAIDGVFLTNSAFDRDCITLNVAEATRLRDQLNDHLKQCKERKNATHRHGATVRGQPDGR